MNTRIQQHPSELFKFKHGLKKHPLYDVWTKIKSRCFKSTDKDYGYYGGRGISMDNNWALNFVQFYYWALDNGYAKGMEIDRENNDGNYCPDNCRFVTRSQNMRNTRRNNLLTYKGQTKCLTEWAEILGVSSKILSGRILALKWTVEKAFETPIHKPVLSPQDKEDVFNRISKGESAHSVAESYSIGYTYARMVYRNFKNNSK